MSNHHPFDYVPSSGFSNTFSTNFGQIYHNPGNESIFSFSPEEHTPINLQEQQSEMSHPLFNFSGNFTPLNANPVPKPVGVPKRKSRRRLRYPTDPITHTEPPNMEDVTNQTNDDSLYRKANEFQKMFLTELENSDFSSKHVCSVCATTQNHVQQLQLSIDASYLSPITDLTKNKLLIFKRSVKFWGSEVQLNVCTLCDSYLSKEQCPPLSYKYKYFPTKVAPVELQNLTLIEKMIISRIIVFQSIITVQGQYAATRSNAIAFFNDPTENIRRMNLPTNPSELSRHIFFVIPSTNTKKTILNLLQMQTIPPYLNYLKVRKEKVYKALDYLIKNNAYYNGITINYNVTLPDNGIPIELISQLIKYLSDIGEHNDSDFNGDPRQGHIVNEISESIEEGMDIENSETETYIEGIIDFDKDPTIIQNIINELKAKDGANIIIGPNLHEIASFENEPGFLSKAFPYLFYDSNKLWSCEKIYPKIGGTLGLTKLLLKSCNPSFAADPHFVLFMMNQWQKEKTLKAASFQLYTNFSRWCSTLLKATPDELSDPSSNFMKKLAGTVQNLTKNERGSVGYKKKGHNDVLALNRLIGCPSIFLTVSSPEAHCLYTMLAIKRRMFLFENPAKDASSITIDSPEVKNIPFSTRRYLCNTSN